MGLSLGDGHAARIAQVLERSMPARSVVAASSQRSLTRYGLAPPSNPVHLGP
ncbi:hypothetical protein [Microvirga alba]|uniref:Uncharacterized protein n=1 Tax=Microvirga alba TaxID=2791025 RepID=A0A931FPA0_9HYPH|nr:hypothetical protein [Microvirga alba]MBF9232208.1 hypothetical protein [Microvirga alba]